MRGEQHKLEDNAAAIEGRPARMVDGEIGWGIKEGSALRSWDALGSPREAAG